VIRVFHRSLTPTLATCVRLPDRLTYKSNVWQISVGRDLSSLCCFYIILSPLRIMSISPLQRALSVVFTFTLLVPALVTVVLESFLLTLVLPT
jgi:hypothetical protein